MADNLGEIVRDKDDQKHVMDHRCTLMTKPTWDNCTPDNCPGDYENGSDTWLKIVNDEKKESKCWTCPQLREMYPNVGNCDYFQKKYGEGPHREDEATSITDLGL